MKVRMGFVSNSSSASFIAGVAVVSDIDKFMKWNNSNKYKIQLKLLSEIISEKYNPCFENGNVYYEGFNGSRASININTVNENLPVNEAAKELLAASENPYIAWFDESGDTPSWDEEADEYNYDDVNLDWFEKEHQQLYKLFNGNNIPGIKKSVAIMGAGRDG